MMMKFVILLNLQEKWYGLVLFLGKFFLDFPSTMHKFCTCYTGTFVVQIYDICFILIF